MIPIRVLSKLLIAQMPHRFAVLRSVAFLMFLCGSAGLGAKCACAQEPSHATHDAKTGDGETGSASIDDLAFDPFAAVVRTYCIECHNDDSLRGNLSLETRESAAIGGDNGPLVLEANLADNIIWQRVTHENIAVRMPKNADALPETDLEAIKQWIEAGCPWPDNATVESQSVAAASGKPLADDSTGSWTNGIPFIDALLEIEEQSRILTYRTQRLIAVLGFALLLLGIERYRRRANRGVATKRDRILERLKARHLLMLASVVVMATFAELRHRQYAEIKKGLRDANAALARARQVNSSHERTLILPVRPRHARGLQKTYYRGNCEKNDALFNQGNYRTATFELRLVNGLGDVVVPGQSIADVDVFIEFTMTRANGAAEELFSPGVIKNIALAAVTEEGKPLDDDSQFVRLTEVEEGRQWRLNFPLAVMRDEEGIFGKIFVYHGRTEGELSGAPHYAVVAEVPFEEERVGGDADIWMASTFFPPAAQLPVESQVTPGEWFDVRPIPEIEGRNTDDPKLLGIEEHRSLIDKLDAESPVETE